MGIGIIEWSDDSVASESVAFNPLSTQTFPSLPIDLLDLSGGNRDSRSGMVSIAKTRFIIIIIIIWYLTVMSCTTER